MKIIFNEQKLKISDRLKQKIEVKFEKSLEKYLKHYQDDLKIASLSIEKITRSGYQVKFDMNLPACPVNISETGKALLDTIVSVKDKAKRTIRKNLEKLKKY